VVIPDALGIKPVHATTTAALFVLRHHHTLYGFHRYGTYKCLALVVVPFAIENRYEASTADGKLAVGTFKVPVVER